MPVQKITEPVARSAERTAIWDTELKGFGLVARTSGTKSWVIQKKIAGRKTRVTLGRYPVLNVAEARSFARVKLLEIETGWQPEPDKLELTLRDAVREHKADMENDGRSSGDTFEHEVTLYLGDWLDRPLASISPQEIRARHREMAKIPATANRALREFRAAYNTALGIDRHLPANPTSGLKWFHVPKRETIITDLADWHKRLQKISNPIVRHSLEFSLLTGMRVTDVLTMRWEDVDRSGLVLHRPCPKGGTRRAFNVPLTERLVSLMDHGWQSEWVWPSTHSGHLVNVRKPAKGVGITTKIHDLRRTYATVAARERVPQHIVGRLLNHSWATQTADYQVLTADDLRPYQEQIGDALVRSFNPQG